jgi:hypothetical protein
MNFPEPPRPNRPEPPRPDLSGQPHPPQYPTGVQANDMAVAALVLGIVGSVLRLFSLAGFIALICGMLARVFGLVGYDNAKKAGLPHRSLAIWRVILGVVSIVLGIVGAIIVRTL